MIVNHSSSSAPEGYCDPILQAIDQASKPIDTSHWSSFTLEELQEILTGVQSKQAEEIEQIKQKYAQKTATLRAAIEEKLQAS